jgi:hypothetical protein
MELQPFGPVEQAVQKSSSPKPKTSGSFWNGVVTTLLTLGLALLMSPYTLRKKDKPQAKDPVTDEPSKNS